MTNRNWINPTEEMVMNGAASRIQTITERMASPSRMKERNIAVDAEAIIAEAKKIIAQAEEIRRNGGGEARADDWMYRVGNEGRPNA